VEIHPNTIKFIDNLQAQRPGQKNALIWDGLVIMMKLKSFLTREVNDNPRLTSGQYLYSICQYWTEDPVEDHLVTVKLSWESSGLSETFSAISGYLSSETNL